MNLPWNNLLPPGGEILPIMLAGAMVVIGLMLWGAGIKIARIYAAASLGLTGAAAAGFFLPPLTGLAFVPCAIAGLVAGILLGALAFRIVQAVFLSTGLAIVGAACYFGAIGGTPQALLPTDITVANWQEAAQAAVQNAPRKAGGKAVEPLDALAGRAISQGWNAIPAYDRQRMILVAIAVGLATLLSAAAFPRYATWIWTATAGASLLSAGGFVLLQYFNPRYQLPIPAAPLPRAGLVVVLVLTGMLIQRRLFWRTKRAAAPERESTDQTAYAQIAPA